MKPHHSATRPALRKLLLPFAFFLTFMIGGVFSLQATHLLGGDISVQSLGSQNVYMVQLRLYRDCAGITLPTSETVWADNFGCGSDSMGLTLSQVGTPYEVTSCVPGLTTCQGGSMPGMMVHTYQAIVTLPFDTLCTEWNFYYSTCCRSGALSNLQSPNSESFWIETNVNIKDMNSSPEFDPVFSPFACVNQQFDYSFHATDADGDSLLYSLVPAENTLNTPVIYAPGFSATVPFTTATGITLDWAGHLHFIANSVQFPVVTVRVDEYSHINGAYLGSSVRDIAIPMIPCSGTQCGDNILMGNVYRDENSDCIFDPTEQGMWQWVVRADPGPMYTLTQPDGSYQFHLAPGTYTVSIPAGQHPIFTETCPPGGSYTVNFPAQGDTSANNDFGLEGPDDCAAMYVDVSTWNMRACNWTNWSVQYCNYGTDTAYNAEIVVTLDSNLTYTSTTGPISSINGDVLTFAVGDVPPNFCSTFTVRTWLTCDTTWFGRTLCVEAHAYPDSSCLPADTAWDRSSVNITGQCVNDSLVCFNIQNTGDPSNGNMTGPTDWRVYLNGQLWASGTLQLCGGCDTTMCFAPAGGTVRIEVDQRPGHPGNSHPTETVELCGNPNDTLGMYNILPEDDADAFVSIHCEEVSFSWDPNEKHSMPVGVGPQKMITDSDELEYVIHFQNTGTDTAFTVVIEDHLSQYLDIATVQPGAASHPYLFELDSADMLRWTFNNIMLPDSSTDEPNSHGWVKFRVSQIPGNVDGTVIENTAGIIFDINSPVWTNTEFNTVGDPIVLSQADPTPIRQFGNVKAWPNPFSESVTFQTEGLEPGQEIRIEWYNILGAKVKEAFGRTGEEIEMDRDNLETGIYLFRVMQGTTMIGSGKLVVQ